MPEFGSLLPPPPAERRGIPLYYQKSEKEIRQDVYERYDELVARQTALHLADRLYGGYPLQPLADYLSHWLPTLSTPHPRVADIGCSVGRLIGDLATLYPGWDCYGIDFSYQMLRQARDYWNEGQTLSPNLLHFGYELQALPGKHLPNLHFALANGQALPFPDDSLDVLFNTFLLDRLPDPFCGLAEWKRVLRSGGRLICVTPLNFLKVVQWDLYHPPVKIIDHVLTSGWELLDLTDPLPLREPMDARGNAVHWNALAFVVENP